MKSLNDVMVRMKLKRAIAKTRHLNPEMYKVINDLWKTEIGESNLFKLRFTLTYVLNYLEEYLSLCLKKY